MKLEKPPPLRLFTSDQEIAVVPIKDWLDWVTERNTNILVALPMIQRGSVWTADKIVNLWDSLLRGMPVGSFTVSVFKDHQPNQSVRLIGKRETSQMAIPDESLSLLDGQQRTLAMCIGWGLPKGREMDRRVWVDFSKSGAGGHPFCLRATTRFQPFGFEPHNQSQRLALGKRRNARRDFDTVTNNEYQSVPDYRLPLDKTLPYESIAPIDLGWAINQWRESAGLDDWAYKVMGCLQLKIEDLTAVETRVRSFGKALERFFRMQVALVRVHDGLLADETSSDNDTAVEPPLVVLFERIANAGARLSADDYAFSLIKHRFPEAHNLVQDLHGSETVASLVSATQLVMTAVRVATGIHRDENGNLLPDNPTPSAKEFNRLIRHRIRGGHDFLNGAVIPLLHGESSLRVSFNTLQALLMFRACSDGLDAGFPQLAFPVFQRQLVQILVFWVHQRLHAPNDPESTNADIKASRGEILRFCLFWLLCVGDSEKTRESAGKAAFKELRTTNKYSRFPGKQLMDLLCASDQMLAVKLRPPANLKNLILTSLLSGKQFVASRTTRFDQNSTDPTASQLAKSWFYRKKILLWLQRKDVASNPAYVGINPLAGPERDQETPYDFDHITPRDDWDRDGRYQAGTALYHFCEEEDRWALGDNIGNMRIIDSSSNRRDGNSPPDIKLRLRPELDCSVSRQLLAASDISPEEAILWTQCSSENMGHWEESRAKDFKKAVEQRAYRLYERLYDEAGFKQWETPPPPEDHDPIT